MVKEAELSIYLGIILPTQVVCLSRILSMYEWFKELTLYKETPLDILLTKMALDKKNDGFKKKSSFS